MCSNDCIVVSHIDVLYVMVAIAFAGAATAQGRDIMLLS